MQLIDADKAASILGLANRMQIYDAARNGFIPPGVAVRIGRRLRFDLDALKEWAARGGTPLNEQAEGDGTKDV